MNGLAKSFLSLAARRPKRIQLSRKKGWRKPPNTVVVARPSRFGNPFIVQDILPSDNPQTLMMDAQAGVCFSRAAAVQRFRFWIQARPKLMAEIRAKLRGKNLACWCPLNEPCHADVLLVIANRKDFRPGRCDSCGRFLTKGGQCKYKECPGYPD